MTPHDPAPHLAATAFIDADHRSIRDRAEALGALAGPPERRAVSLFDFVRDQVAYNAMGPILEPKTYAASAVLARGEGYCVQKAVLLAALARCAGIPAKLCFADIVSHRVPEDLRAIMGTNLFTYHGYVKLRLSGRWIKATPAFDRAMCDRQGYRLVAFDAKHDAVFHAADLAGRPHIDYVRSIGCYAELPLRDILDAFARVYGSNNPDLLERWNSPR